MILLTIVAFDLDQIAYDSEGQPYYTQYQGALKASRFKLLTRIPTCNLIGEAVYSAGTNGEGIQYQPYDDQLYSYHNAQGHCIPL
jgi:hypothetical protein